MLQSLGCLILLIILVPILLFGSVVMRLLNLFNIGKRFNPQAPGSQGSTAHDSTSGGKRKPSPSPSNKIFKPGEGEYVDFEEVE